MLNLFIKSIVLFLAFGSAAQASAPQKYSNCQVQLKIPVDASSYYFSEDCKTVYILPPVTGFVGVDQVAPSVNSALCEVVNSQFTSIANNLKHQNTIKKTITTTGVSSATARTLERTQKKCDKVDAKYGEAEAGLAGANAMKEQLQISVVDLERQLKACTQNCYRIESTLKLTEKNLQRISTTIPGIAGALAQLSVKVKTCQKELQKYEARALQENTQSDEIIEEVNNQVDAVTETVASLYSTYSDQHGDTMNLVFENRHADLVSRFAKLNKGRGYDFVPMPVRATLSATVKVAGKESYLPAIISSTVPGYSIAKNLEPTGDLVEPLSASSDEDDSGMANRHFGSSLGGQLTLNLAASCAVKSAYQRDANSSFTAYMVANVYYQYEVQVSRGYKVEFKLSEVMKRIKDQTKKKGFFKTKTINSLSESNDSDEWIKITFESDEGRYQWQDEDQLRTNIKREFINRALAKVVKYKVPNPELIEPYERGVESSSRIIRENCKNQYCQYGALVLDVVGSAVGGTSAVDKFISTNNVWQTETVRHKQMVSHWGSYTFKSK